MTPSQLYSRILPHVPGCPEPLVDQAVIDTAIDFAQRTQIVFTISRPVPLVDGRSTYSVYGDYGLEPDLIRGVFVGARELVLASSLAALHDLMPGWATAESSEPTAYSCFGDAGSITVYPKPLNSSGAVMRINATWAPTMDATSIPDELGRGYFLELIDGAKAKLMMMEGRKWSNPVLAGVAEKKYEDGLALVRIKAIHGKAAGSTVVRPRQFGSS